MLNVIKMSITLSFRVLPGNDFYRELAELEDEQFVVPDDSYPLLLVSNLGKELLLDEFCNDLERSKVIIRRESNGIFIDCVFNLFIDNKLSLLDLLVIFVNSQKKAVDCLKDRHDFLWFDFLGLNTKIN